MPVNHSNKYKLEFPSSAAFHINQIYFILKICHHIKILSYRFEVSHVHEFSKRTSSH